ncbi:MAG: DUF6597 domain-containing transcriptional factor [Pyrinomonadaceae bacterium]
MDQSSTPCSVLADRERVLPTGTMHLAIRLSNHPLRLFEDVHDCTRREIGYAIVGGARSTYYVRDISEPASSVGAQLLPGASELLFGVPADELAGRHTSLEDLWGHSAVEARERLLEGGSLERRLDIFEALLVARLQPAVPGVRRNNTERVRRTLAVVPKSRSHPPITTLTDCRVNFVQDRKSLGKYLATVVHSREENTNENTRAVRLSVRRERSKGN